MTYKIIRPSQKCGGFFYAPNPDHLFPHPTLLSAQDRVDNNVNWPRKLGSGVRQGELLPAQI